MVWGHSDWGLDLEHGEEDGYLGQVSDVILRPNVLLHVSRDFFALLFGESVE